MFTAILALSIIVALVNGLQDAPNAITTSIVTKSLTVRTARIYVAALNALGIVFGVLLIAYLHSSLLTVIGFPTFVEHSGINLGVVLATALAVTITWSLAAYAFGIPISGWNCTLSALAGGALAGGAGSIPPLVLWGGLIPIILSPLLGFGVSYVLTLGIQRLRYERLLTVESIRMAQTLSAGLVAAGHGISNGRIPLAFIVIAATGVHEGFIAAPGWFKIDVLTSSVFTHSPVSWWVLALVAIALGLGSYTGGRRIILTLGRKLTDLTPAQGLAAEGTTASLMYIAAMGFGAPVSSTQTVTGSIVGSAVAVSPKSVSWRVLATIIGWWVATPLVCGASAALIVVAVS